MSNRTKNGARNIIAGFLNRFILILLPFIARTAIFYKLGSEYLGLGSLFTSILMVLNLSELGFGSALVYSMYKPIANDDKTKICALLNLYKKIYRYIGIFIVVVGTIFAPFLGYVISGDVPDSINIYVLYFIFLTNSSISYFAYAYKKALLTAHQRNDIISNVNTIIYIGINAIQIGVLFMYPNYYLYVLVYPIFTLLDNLWTAYITKKKYPDLEAIGNINSEEKSAIKNHVKGIALQKLCSTSRNSFDSIVISMFLGLKSLAIYGNYYYIMASIHQFLYQIPNSIRASVGNSVASETLEKNYNDFCSMYLLYMWIGGFCSVCLLCLFQPFMKLWMGPDMLCPLSTIILVCFYFLLLCLSDITALYKDGAGLWWHGRYRVIIEAVANLVLNFLLGWLFGINGILIATIITLLIIGHGYGGWIVFRHYFVGYSFGKFILNQILYIFIITIVSLISYLLCEALPYEGIANLICRFFLCLSFTNIIFGVVFRFHPDHKKSMCFAKNISKVVKRGRKK